MAYISLYVTTCNLAPFLLQNLTFRQNWNNMVAIMARNGSRGVTALVWPTALPMHSSNAKDARPTANDITQAGFSSKICSRWCTWQIFSTFQDLIHFVLRSILRNSHIPNILSWAFQSLKCYQIGCKKLFQDIWKAFIVNKILWNPHLCKPVCFCQLHSIFYLLKCFYLSWDTQLSYSIFISNSSLNTEVLVRSEKLWTVTVPNLPQILCYSTFRKKECIV